MKKPEKYELGYKLWKRDSQCDAKEFLYCDRLARISFIRYLISMSINEAWVYDMRNVIISDIRAECGV